MNDRNQPRTAVKPWGTKAAVALGVLVVAVGGYLLVRDQLQWDALARREEQFQAYERTRPVLTYTVAFLGYVAVTALSLPFATVMSLVYGWLFGFVKGVILVSLASTTGATCSFLLSRYVFGNAVQHRFSEQLVGFNAALEREGAFYLFTLRLVPYVPFFVVNLVMGLTKMRVATFWWVSQLGMLPGTLLYLFAGSSLGSIGDLARGGPGKILTPQLVLAFVLLGIFPWIVKYAVAGLRPNRS